MSRLYVLLLTIIIGGCALYPKVDDCKYRCSRLIQQRGEDCFLVHGTHDGTPHRWIETLDGKLIDPSFPEHVIEESLYVETSREYIHDGVSQGVVSEITDEEYDTWYEFIEENKEKRKI